MASAHIASGPFAMTDKLIRELALNFRERMKQQRLHDQYNKSMVYQKEVNTRMVEFLTGAYVGLRMIGDDKNARLVGEYTQHVAAPLGYLALLRTIDGQSEVPDNALLLDVAGFKGGKIGNA